MGLLDDLSRRMVQAQVEKIQKEIDEGKPVDNRGTIGPGQRNKLLGLLADAIGGVNDYAQRPDPTMPMGKANPVLGLLSEMAGLPGAARALNSASYGHPLTNAGKGSYEPLIPSDTADAAMLVGGLLSPAEKALSGGAAKVGKAIAPAIERAVPRVMERGGLPAQLLGDLSQGTQSPMIVWQGSPHKYDAEKLVRLADGTEAYVGGKFNQLKEVPAGATVLKDFPLGRLRSEAIGTGEGAQAYGHGHYTAESPEVAKSYQTGLSADRGFSFGGKTGLTRAEVQDMVNAKYGAGYLDGVLRPSGVADSFIDDMVTGLSRPDGTYPRQYKPGSERAKVYDELRGQITHADPGSLYKIDLPDEHIARMLDWDKPLSEQPHVMDALGKEYSDSWLKMFADRQGSELYKAMSGGAGVDDMRPLGSEELRKVGIPGIRYLDGGSRGAGAGTSNFVLFPGNEGLATILERNGQGLLAP